jgi:hypothetical protein
MTRQTLTVALLLVISAAAAEAQRRPGIVPPGWTEEAAASDQRGRRYSSPDGSAMLTVHASPAEGSRRDHMDRVASGEGERITYQRRAPGWIAVSGFRGDRIFYRKSNLACGGSRWHTVALEYPAADKRRMDAHVTHIAHAMNSYGDDCPRLRSRARQTD